MPKKSDVDGRYISKFLAFDNWDKFTEKRLALIVFLVALAERLFLSLKFFVQNGAFSAHNYEIWYYYGVANGTFKLLNFDPTSWILGLEGTLLPKKFLFHAIALTASLLTSLTAVLIFLLARKLHGKKTGLVAGIVFASMGQPLASSVASFTHDLVQLPIIILSLLAAVYIMESKGKRKTISLVCLIFLLFLGAQVGPTILVVAIVVPLYFITPITGRSDKRYITFLLLLTVTLVVARFMLFQDLLQYLVYLAKQVRGIDVLSQLEAGSSDLRPITMYKFWHRYNFLLLFIPFGLTVSFKRRDTIAISLLLLGIISSTQVLRGTRILDIGLPLVISNAIIFWNRNWSKYMVVLLMLIFLNVIVLLESIKLYYGIAFIITGAAILSFLHYHLLETRRYVKNMYPSIRVITLVLLIIMVFGVLKVNIKPYATEAEYGVYKWLNSYSDEGETIYVPWPSGYFVEAVTDVKSVTNPAKIDFEFPNFFWLSEYDANRLLRREKVRYVLVSEFDFRLFNIDISSNTFSSGFRGGVLRPPTFSDFSTLTDTLMYKLLYDEDDLEYFKKIHSETDEKTGVEIKLFEVVGTG